MRVNRAKRDRLRDGHSLSLLLSVWGYRFMLLLVMTVCVGKLDVLQITFRTGGCLSLMVVYAVGLIMLQKVYRACAVGQTRVTELVMSQVLAATISAFVMYFGAALYLHKLFNPLGLMVAVVVQILLGVVWSVASNKIYYKHRRQSRTVVICQSKEEYEQLCMTPYFFDKYDVIRVVIGQTEDAQVLGEQLEGCETVFTLNLPATLTHVVSKLCLEKGIVGYFVPRLGHIIMAGAQFQSGFNVPLLRVERAGSHSEYRFFKRMFDIVCSFMGMIALSPVMLATAIAIKAEDHGPVFYRQVRLTKNGREFNILKFRSMTVNAEKDGVARLAGENDSRITKVGHFIRACRIDELPQLINILLGDMSIVGPRPERPEIARQYEDTLPEFYLRLQVKAGLTGLAQVYGRYNTEPYNKLQMDLMYINEMSLLKDLQLILATIKILFLKDSTQGIAQGQETALKATDSKEKSA